MKKITALFVLATMVSFSFAKAKKLVAPEKNPGTQMRIADKFYAESYFYTAAEYYKDAVRQDSSNRYATFWLAMSLLQARDYANAEIFFQNFYEIKPGEKTNKKKWDEEDRVLFNKGEYFYGQVLHRNGKYNEAIEHLNKFIRSYEPKDADDKMKKRAELEIAGCEYSKRAPKAKIKVFSAGTGVNKAYTESAPVGIGETELYYASSKSGGDTLVFVEGTKAKPMYQIMHSTAQGNTWSKGTPVNNKDINDDKYNVGNGAFNASQTRFYFTKCMELDDDRSLCNLYVADYNKGNFSNITRLPEPVNTKEEYTATHPAVRTADDGTEIIYFSTDRPGGAGGMDIWYTTRLANGEFKEAKPIKSSLNTAGDEVTPFFNDSTKILYFSSNGLPGLGGYDIFMVKENPDLTWSEPVNMGATLNSGADELYYSRSTDQTTGFFVSNREGSVPLNGIKTASDDVFYWRNFRYAAEGVAIKEGDGLASLEGASFKLYRRQADGTKVLVGIDSTTAKKTGKPGSYFFGKLNPETDYEVVVEKEGLQPKIEKISTRGLPDEDTINSKILTRKSMFTVKGMIVEEGSPGTGVKDANVELVEVFPNGMEKTAYYMKSDPYYYFDVEMNHNYKVITRKEGYFANTTNLSTAGAGDIDTMRKDIAITKLELNKAYTLQNVLYEFGKATLTENSKTVLDNLYQIMVENPSFVIELSAHTDAIGSDAGNMKLSQARAESCVSYLISKGIAKDRLVAKGYGKTRPKVPNTTEDGKDDPAGRAINRRTEFQIVGVKKEQ